MPEATSLMEAPTTAGTYAQYAVVSESVLGIKPKSLSISVPETKPGSLACLEQHPIPQPRHAWSRCHADGCPHWAWVPDAGGRWSSFSKRKYDCASAWGKKLGLIECCFRPREIWSLGFLPKMPCLLLTCPVHAWYSLDFVNFRSFLVSICSLPVSLGGGTGHMGIQLAKAGLQTNYAFFFSASIPAIQMVHR